MSKETTREFCARMVNAYPGVLRTDFSILHCNYCDCSLTGNKLSNVKQHFDTAKHKKAVENKKQSNEPKQTLLTDHQLPQQINTFNMDLCKTFLEANIPLKKVSHPSVVKFLEQYTGKTMPSESSLRQKYVPILFNEKLEKLRQKAKDKFIWTSIDETTDSEGRYVTNFIFGILDGSDDSPERGKCYLLNMVPVEAANASNMAAFFNDSLLLLWPSGKWKHLCVFFCLFVLK